MKITVHFLFLIGASVGRYENYNASNSNVYVPIGLVNTPERSETIGDVLLFLSVFFSTWINILRFLFKRMVKSIYTNFFRLAFVVLFFFCSCFYNVFTYKPYVLYI